ncbi:hypothetical protein PLICRDRAFT_121709 [Plicaturopsis crispa FD-325 SS-3]|nr:hypothetical protein PLICRDRAFT_121709 [Plicaturopsis crispa FD-325 SS-3]
MAKVIPSSSRPQSPEPRDPHPQDENGVLKSEHSDVDINESLRSAEELKQEGNDYFREKRWNEALNSYRTAVGRLPRRKERAKARPHSPGDADSERTTDDIDHRDTPDAESEEPAGNAARDDAQTESPLEAECAKTRSILNANIGACYVKLDEHKEAVKACTEALLDDPHYIKALQRRAASNEKINSWSSLTSAQEDYNTLLTLVSKDSPQIVEIKRSLQYLKPRVEAAQKAETAEMLDKLKGLGNSVLGNFGLSTDNFKFEPNGQGGYSMNFVQ